MSDTPKEPSDPAKFRPIDSAALLAKNLDRAMDRIERPSPEMAARIKNLWGIGELTEAASNWFVVGTPDSSGTTVTITEASKRLGVSLSNLRRRLKEGKVPGAYKAGGPNGIEWRIPVAYLPELPTTPEVRSDSVEVVELRSRLELSEALRLRAEAEVENLRRALSDALTKIPPAIAPPPPPAPKRHWWSRTAK